MSEIIIQGSVSSIVVDGVAWGPVGDQCPQMVTDLYHELYHREPDAGGFAYWVGQCEAGMAKDQMKAAMIAIEPPVGGPTGPTGPTGAIGATGANPSAIVPWPAWLAWNALYEATPGVPGFRANSGVISAFVVPQNPGNTYVALLLGQMPITPAHTTLEFFYSPLPGVIDPASPLYQKVYPFGNFWKYEVSQQPYLGGYLNLRLTYDFAQYPPGGVSLQWGN